MGYVTLVAGTTITSSWANSEIRDQVIAPFASTAARDSAITSPVIGQVAYLKTNGVDEGLTTRTTSATWRKPWNLPWGVLAYNQVTANTASIGGTEATVVGCVPSTVANRRTRVTTGCAAVVCTTVNGAVELGQQRIYRGSTQIGAVTALSLQTSGNAAFWAGTAYDVPGTSAVVTNEFRFVRAGGVGTWTVFASATFPAFICVEDVGPTGSPA